MGRYDRHMPKYQTEDTCGTVVGIVLLLVLVKAIYGLDVLSWLGF
jgi:hypothetical protein